MHLGLYAFWAFRSGRAALWTKRFFLALALRPVFCCFPAEARGAWDQAVPFCVCAWACVFLFVFRSAGLWTKRFPFAFALGPVCFFPVRSGRAAPGTKRMPFEIGRCQVHALMPTLSPKCFSYGLSEATSAPITSSPRPCRIKGARRAAPMQPCIYIYIYIYLFIYS